MIELYLRRTLFLALLSLLAVLSSTPELRGQTPSSERMRLIEERLRNLAITHAGLNQEVQLSMSGASAQEFLRALAQANNLNINIDPSLNFKIYNNFTNETALNVLLFLANQYNLDINLIGSIMSISQRAETRAPVPVRQINARYNPQNNTLSLELNNDSLGQVAKKITQISQKNVVVPVTLIGKTVTAFFSDAPFESALEKLAFANNLKVIRTNDNAYVFEALREGEELYIDNERNTAVRRNPLPSINQGSQAGKFNISSKTTSLGNKLISIDASNAAIVDLIRSASEEVNTNYFIYSDIRGNITTRINNISYDDFLGSLLQGTEYTYRRDNGVYLIGDRKLEGLRANKVVQLQYRSIDTIQAMIPTEWRKGVEIKEFREQNTLLLSGSSPQISEIENYIRQIDKLVPMVLIEVTLLDVRKGRTVSTGITAGVDTTGRIRSGGTLLPGIDYTFGAGSINDFLSRLGRNNSINLGRVTPNFYASIKALETNNNVEIRSVPKLSTLNGHIANLSIGSKRYYSTETQNVIPSFSSQTLITRQFTPVEANLAINIKPVVSGDDQVTLNIKVDISDFIGNPGPNEPPPTSTSKFESIIRARNEDMIVLGGLERTESTSSGSGVPLLSRIPVLKWFFSRKEKGTNKVVTIVFIKPTITY